jgi:hypothetical protein
MFNRQVQPDDDQRKPSDKKRVKHAPPDWESKLVILDTKIGGYDRLWGCMAT